MAEVQDKAKEEPVTQYIGGELHIVADAKTGQIGVNAPPNIIVALGLLELAKVIIVDKQKEAMRAQPTIVPAHPNDLNVLNRKNS